MAQHNFDDKSDTALESSTIIDPNLGGQMASLVHNEFNHHYLYFT